MPPFKRRLSESEEFDIMKLVLDKFLWLSTALMGWGLYVIITTGDSAGMWFIGIGAVVMLLFAWIIIREFEHVR